MRFKTALAAFLVPLALMLSACSSVTSGEITDKNYTEAYQTEEPVTEQVCEKEKRTTGTGKNKKTSYVNECEEEETGEMETVDHPATYEFVLTDKDDKTGEVDVDEETYNSYEVGDFYDSETN
jgi:hypothetical protein